VISLPDPRHFAVPFRFERLRDGRVRPATTAQGTNEEIADCVELILRTVAGQRATLQGFGRPDLEFGDNAEVMRSALEAAIDQWEPRARAVAEGAFDETDPAAVRLRAMFRLAGEGVLR
jgi:phage baseplate assembly protein W